MSDPDKRTQAEIDEERDDPNTDQYVSDANKLPFAEGCGWSTKGCLLMMLAVIVIVSLAIVLLTQWFGVGG